MTKKVFKSQNEIAQVVEFEYTITRSKRKTLSLIIEKNRTLKVLAPLRCPDDYIEKLLEKKMNWIHKHFSQLEAINIEKSELKTFKFENNSPFNLMGKVWTVKHCSVKLKMDEKIELSTKDQHLMIYSRAFNYEKLYAQMDKWVKEYAKKKLSEQVQLKSEDLKLYPTKISIKNQKSRWGTCTSKGHIMLNWRLIFAPPSIAEYVIIHELCHMRHMNHSALFWLEVEKYDSTYKTQRDWLKRNGHLLEWDKL